MGMRWLPLAILLASNAATAQDAVERARPHFDAGQQYYADGEFASALREFRRAHELTQHPELLYNIALCYERLGELDRAVETLERYLASEGQVAERAAAQEELARIRGVIA